MFRLLTVLVDLGGAVACANGDKVVRWKTIDAGLFGEKLRGMHEYRM